MALGLSAWLVFIRQLLRQEPVKRELETFCLEQLGLAGVVAICGAIAGPQPRAMAVKRDGSPYR